MNWQKMAIISIIAGSAQRLRHFFLEGAVNLINGILDQNLDFQKCEFWDFAKIAQFLDLTCDFYKKIKSNVLWLAFLPECGEIKWAYLSKNLLVYLEDVDLIPKGKTFTGPLDLYWHLFLDKQLVDLRELLCNSSPAIQDATLKAIKLTPHKFDHVLIKLAPDNNDPLIIKELIEYINKHNLQK